MNRLTGLSGSYGIVGAALTCAFVAVIAAGCSRSDLDLDTTGSGLDGGDDGPPVEGAPPPSCGNGTCDPGETCENCSVDCGLCPSCGNGTCDENETCSSCPQDCGACATCGDGKCEMPQETCENCAQDCGACPGCGDGVCSAPKETCFTCPQDCGKCAGCGDGICQSNETCASCPMDCGPCSVCGNGKCEMPYETCINCPQDCGQCPVHTCFQDLTCAIGCFGGLGGLGGGGGGGGGSSSGGGGDAGSGSGGIPNINLTCIVDCLAEGCSSAQYFAQQAVNCFIDNIGTCGGLNINCLMSACSGPVAACIGDKCNGG